MRVRRLLIPLLLVIIIIAIALARQAGRFLVIDNPVQSDAIVALAGDTKVRPARALELLRQGIAPRAFLDAEVRERIYDQPLSDLVQKYINNAGEANRMNVCPILGLSTAAEAEDISKCLQSVGAHRVLIVTSDYHTRRASLILRHRLPQYQISLAAARDPIAFGEAWWTKREWAKTALDEWQKLVWWEIVDQWR